jgi:RimJ/RimL family protein N-acetyltransferase
VADIRNKHIKYLRQKWMLSEREQEEWFINDSQKHGLWYVWENNYYELCGVFGLTYIDWQSRKAELSFITKEYVNESSGQMVLEALKIAFNELNMNKVWVEIYEFDQVKWDLLVRLGFSQDGILRENYYWDGKWYSSIILSIVKSDYDKSNKR